jgi:hypothetical protein
MAICAVLPSALSAALETRPNHQQNIMPISLSVNIDKIDKKRFFEGKKGRYLDLILFETPDSDYGDYLVKQRGERNEKMPILGNGKYFKPKDKKAKEKGDNDEDESGSGGGKSDPW